MTDTIIKIDLSKSAYDNDQVHNRWHPDIPMVATVKPGDDFIVECYDWTGGQIKNDDDASDVRDVDLSQVHFLSGPIAVEGAEPGDLLEVDILDIGAFEESQWGFNGFFSKKNGGGFLTDRFPEAQKSIWDFKGMMTSSRHVPGVEFAGILHPGLIGCLPDKKRQARAVNVNREIHFRTACQVFNVTVTTVLTWRYRTCPFSGRFFFFLTF